MNLVEVNSLTKKFTPVKGLLRLVAKTPLKSEIVAVDNVSFAVKSGEILALVGPNGAGKTTLIKMLCTLLLPTSGSAIINGYDLTREENKVKASIGYVSGDERSFFWRLTGRENLEFFGTLCELAGELAQKRIDEVLEIVGLSQASNNMFYSYSSGMKQRLAIARALLTKPRVLFLDEFTKSLDALAAHSLYQILRRMAEERGTAVVLASNQLNELEEVCDLVLVLNQGKTQYCGTLEHLMTRMRKGKRYALELSGITPEVLRLHFLSYSDITDVLINPIQQGDTVEVEFTSLNGNSIMARVLKNVLNTGAEVISCCKKEPQFKELIVEQFQGGKN